MVFQGFILSAGQKTQQGRKRNRGGLDRLFEFPLLRGGRDIFRIGGSSNPPELITTA
jgi:hypothetical protein